MADSTSRHLLKNEQWALGSNGRSTSLSSDHMKSATSGLQACEVQNETASNGRSDHLGRHFVCSIDFARLHPDQTTPHRRKAFLEVQNHANGEVPRRTSYSATGIVPGPIAKILLLRTAIHSLDYTTWHAHHITAHCMYSTTSTTSACILKAQQLHAPCDLLHID